MSLISQNLIGLLCAGLENGADKAEYQENLPYLFCPGNDGFMSCIKSIMGFDLSIFSDIYFTILKKHDKIYQLYNMFLDQLSRLGLDNKTHIVLLDTQTQS
jgi:hypothetical protein